jgi:hypothetical protein
MTCMTSLISKLRRFCADTFLIKEQVASYFFIFCCCSLVVPVVLRRRYGVPYFKDSTPSWSTRGKLRTHLLPLLVDMYGAGCLANLANLAAESDQSRMLVQNTLYEPFMRYVLAGQAVGALLLLLLLLLCSH